MKQTLLPALVLVLGATVLVLLYRDVTRPVVVTKVVQSTGSTGQREPNVQLPGGGATDDAISSKYSGIKLPSASGKISGEISAAEAENRFFNFFTRQQVECQDVKRMGSQGDGGWDMCVSEPYAPGKPCLVYSFGTGSDWSFDDHMSVTYGCEVHAFDPTVNRPPYKKPDLVTFHHEGLYNFDGTYARGPVKKLSTIMKELGHENKIIDYLKVDIEGSEWPAFENMLQEGVLKNVKQFSFEFHTPDTLYFGKKIGVTKKENFIQMVNIMAEIEKQGFRRYLMHENTAGRYTSQFTHSVRSCCWELYYININFLKS